MMQARRRVEPLLWLLFSAGGVMAALFFPALLFLFGIAFPLRWLSPPGYDQLLGIVSYPLTRLLLLAVCSLSLFHWAHRFRYTLYDGLQIKHLNEVINAVCYGGAILGSLLTAYLVWRIP
jgi:fumarate reductase subunit D